MSNMEHVSEPEVRIVLFGRTGVGKSSSGNRILGQDIFPVNQSFNSVTQDCQREIRKLGDDSGEALAGKTLAIVDTPGLCHTKKDHESVMEEILNCITLIQPGPHVFLFVVDLSEFSQDDEDTLENFKKVFEKSKSHTIVLFTHCQDKRDIKKFLEQSRNKSLSDYIKLGVDHQAFDNKAENNQVTELLEKINKLVNKNGGKYCEGAVFEKAKTAFEEMQKCKLLDSSLDVSVQLRQWYHKGVDELEKHCPFVKSYIDFVVKLAYECMPPEAKQ
ncbi:GTPase IMAP family member 7-like [Seriola dumerili]|uniref:GTPase IMAP family member 7-like n=1 Tax=Seriola dumerili TaxID=41447 RepID=UPI000BBE2CB4|nr:GTPase IMAP family member 7-like [Seriola dumerili]